MVDVPQPLEPGAPRNPAPAPEITPVNQTAIQAAPAARRRFGPLTMALIMIVPLLIVIGLGIALIQSNQGQLSTGLAPNFTLATYDGDEFTLAAHRGKVVLLNFWASWCGPCRSEAADLNQIWDEYRHSEFIMFGVGYLDNEKDARGFLQEFGVQYPTGHDNGNAVSRAYRTKGVPETFIIDRQGHLRYVMPYPMTARELRPILDRLLAEPGPGAQ